MEKKWWKEAIGYQIYPRSFYDSNGDGIGDIKGVIEKLDYLSYLGITLIWLSPIYKSPMDDNGYDVSDYYSIASEFGTLDDFQLLLNEAHTRNIYVIMDLILNHTSDEHPWFVESRISKTNPCRDYYIWKEGPTDPTCGFNEPNNWASFFTPSCWEKDYNTGEYFMHIFSKRMPDLNWQCPEMREELFEMAKWWLDLGLDGFRLDAINHIVKDTSFSNSSMESNSIYKPDWDKFSNFAKVHEHLNEMHNTVFSGRNVLAVGELGSITSMEQILDYTGYDRNELNMVFTYDHCFFNNVYDSLNTNWIKENDIIGLKSAFNRWQTQLYKKAWNPIYWLNHDHPRVISHYGDYVFHEKSGKMLATILLTLRGTPFIYNGEEIGMTNANFDNLDSYKDVAAISKIEQLRNEGYCDNSILNFLHNTSRDNARLPIQWNCSLNSGFTSGTPWIEVNDNYFLINIHSQIEDDSSILNHYRKLISLRKSIDFKDALVYGSFRLLIADHPFLFCYTRKEKDVTLLVFNNFSSNFGTITLPELIHGKVVISNYDSYTFENNTLDFKPYESIVFQLFLKTV